jgi:RNA polymerase sigma-70 factor (ECF subfamily)
LTAEAHAIVPSASVEATSGLRLAAWAGGGALERRRERSLVRAAQRGDAQAFEALFRRHWPAAHRAAWLVLHDAAGAEDVVQEAFLSAIRALDRFDTRRPFGPWMHRIVVNRAIDAARARALRHEAALSADDRPGPEAEDGRDDVEAALAALSPEHRAVVVLRFVLGYTPGEIAAMLDLPRGTVNSRLRRALDRMEAALCRTN